MINTKILDTVSWIFLAIFVIFVFWYIFGKSPIETSLILPLAVLLLSKFWTISNEFSHWKGDYAQFKENVKESFQRIRNDNEEMKQGLKRLLEKKHGR